MPKNKILVYDDDKGTGRQYAHTMNAAAAVNARFRAHALPPEELEEELKPLIDRRKAFRKNKDWPEGHCVFDGTDIFIIDFDFLEQSPEMTGEHLAYLARCFSRCKLILGLNQFGHNTFDLTLKGHPESYADLNIGSKQLVNPNLWGGKSVGFHPWYWPNLPALLESFDQRCCDVRASLKESSPVCELLGIPDNVMRFLPRSVAEFIGKQPPSVTCAQFVLKSGNGLRSRDAKKQERSVPAEMIATIATARLSKWLERLVLPGQDILVDAPHLVSRFPSLLKGDPKKIATWQKTTVIGQSHKRVGIRWQSVEGFRHKKGHWLSRPAWFWRGLCEAQDVDIKEVKDPWTVQVPNWVFCEDASRFCKRKDCKEFVADTESPYARRFAKAFRGVDYQPTVRFSY